MRKIIAIFSVVLLLFATVTGCQQSKDKAEQTETNAKDSTSSEHMAKVQYTCTMHPEVVQDEPGKCPKCGMDLVKKEGDDHDHTQHEH